MSKHRLLPAGILLLITFAVCLGYLTQQPGEETVAGDQPGQFSLSRAMGHLQQISREPHYLGSTGHERVRHYLVEQLRALGLEVEIQQQQVTHQSRRHATRVYNLLARLPGSAPAGERQALLLLSHYDSGAHSSLGASDAGSGVVTLIEGLRAYLATNPAPKNDIILLLSDGEEIGLMGARAFVRDHPWAADVGLVLNFEARGSGGPSYMLMETNGGNRAMLAAFKAAAPSHPVANSLMYSIYKILRNDTDLTVFREEADIQGFNFAFIDDHFDYHTAQDTWQRLDPASLAHQASYLMSGLRYFADADLSALSADSDDVYLTLPGGAILSYPFAWAMPLALAATAGLIGLLLLAGLRGVIRLKGALLAWVPWAAALLASVVMAVPGWWLVHKLFPQYGDILQGFTANGHWYIALVVAWTLAIATACYRRLGRSCSGTELAVPPLLCWAAFNLALAWWLPGGSFFVLPLLAALTVFAWQIFQPNASGWLVGSALLLTPILALFAPLVAMFPIGLGLHMLVVAAILTLLLFGLWVPVYQAVEPKPRHTAVLAGMGAVFFVVAALSAPYGPDNRQPNSVVYLADLDRQQAFFFSYDERLDDFTRQFISESATGRWDGNIWPSSYWSTIARHQPAPLYPLAPTRVTRLVDSVSNGKRRLTWRLTPQRRVYQYRLVANRIIKPLAASINGRALSMEPWAGSKELLRYTLSSENEVVDFELTLPAEEQLELELREVSYEFDKVVPDYRPRSAEMMPKPFVLNDAVIVKQRLM